MTNTPPIAHMGIDDEHPAVHPYVHYVSRRGDPPVARIGYIDTPPVARMGRKVLKYHVKR